MCLHSAKGNRRTLIWKEQSLINISKLYCDQVTPGDWLRYGMAGSGERTGETVPKSASERRPIVVWNITRACNLRCVHCYNDSGMGKVCNEVSNAEAKAVLDDLSEFGVPSVLFSGGEPLIRSDLFDLIGYAVGAFIGGIFLVADLVRMAARRLLHRG